MNRGLIGAILGSAFMALSGSFGCGSSGESDTHGKGGKAGSSSGGTSSGGTMGTSGGTVGTSGGTSGAGSGGTAGTGSGGTSGAGTGGTAGTGTGGTGARAGSGGTGTDGGGAAGQDASTDAAVDAGADAAIVCGNGIVQTGEQCDPPGSPTGNGPCSATCGIPPCSALSVEYVVVTPESVNVPGDVLVLSEATHSAGATIGYRWSVSPENGGTSVSPTSKDTTFRCINAGRYTITITAATALCSKSLSAALTCH